MTQYSKEKITGAGMTPTYTPVTATDTFANDGHTFLHVKNGSGASITATVNRQVTCNFGSTHNLQVTVNAGSEEMIGPFPQDQFNDQNGNVTVTYSATASVTAAAIGT